jgi:alpha-L-arabinofuranosidase
MREGGSVRLAVQSMCVGEGWKGIASILADPTGNTPAHLQPTGQAVQFINAYHGRDMLDVTTGDIPRYVQPYSLCGSPAPTAPVATLDVLATADADTLYIHVINRNFATDVPAFIDLSAFQTIGGNAIHHCYTGRLTDTPAPGEKPEEIVRFIDTPLRPEGNTLRVVLPQRSMSIIEIPVVRK